MLKKRNLLFLSLLILGVLLLSSCFLNPPATEGILKGQIMVPEGTLQAKDLTGQALPNATVNIIDLSTGAIIATTTTDADGYYQVFVSAGGPYILEAIKDGVKLLQVTPQVEVGIEYDLGTTDCASTSVALIAQAMLVAEDYPDNLADIDCAAIIADPNFDDVSNIVCSTGGDPTVSALVQQAIEDFLYPPTPAPVPTPTPTYTVTFNSQGGSAVNSQTVAHSGLVTKPTDPTKAGHTFGGWYKESGCTDDWIFATDTVTANVTLYAKWKSTDATLSDLTVDGTTVTGFDPTTLDYNKELPYGTTTVPTVGATTNDSNASKVITQAASVTGTATVVVTAEDGTTQKIYTVTLSVAAASTDATLSDLSLSSGTLVPTFASATISYTASVTNNITSISVTPTAADTNATITVNGVSVASGSASGAISLNVGENTITTIVTAQDGTTTKTYTVTVTRDASSAKAITVFDFKALDPEVVGVVNEGAKTITLTVPFGTVVTALVPTIVHTGVSISLASGTAQDFTSPVNYTVTAEDLSTQAYIVTVTVAAPVIATTSTIAIGESAPSVTVTGINFESGIGPSDLTIGLGTTGLTLDSVSFVSATEITVAFTGTAAVGEVTIQANTSAFDPVSGSASNTLTITVRLLVVGDIYGGGKVAYIFEGGDTGYVEGETHGLIAAAEDQSDSQVFSNVTNAEIGTSAQETAIGKGQENTTAIIGQSGHTASAAKVCDDYSVTVDSVIYNDWFLPSKDELYKLYLNKGTIGGFADYYYWSSSEDDANYAWAQGFSNGVQDDDLKDDTARVRAVRAF